jgi:ABC-2 type transport system ATP-binding protein
MERGSIITQGLTRSFASMRAVDGVDLDIRPSEIFAFLGPNGAGKTTTVKILTSILAPTSGSAFVSGLDVTRHGHQVRMQIGVALQDVGIDPLMTATEMLILQARLFGEPRSVALAKAQSLLATVGLDDVPENKRVGQYSGGMKRRLDLALALVHDPAILFLDEPTTGLDPVSRVTIWEEVRRLNRDLGMTIFLTTQYLEEADRLADRVAIIDRGRIVAEGTPSELKRAMGEEVIVMHFATDDLAARATDALKSFPGRRQTEHDEVSCYLSNAAQSVPALIRTLDEADLSPVDLTIAKPTLDDVFLRATGARMSAADPDASDPKPDAPVESTR